MKNVAFLLEYFKYLFGLVHVFLWNKKCKFCNKTVKPLSKHLWRCPKKLRQQPLQEVHNHDNYVKNNFYIKICERLLENDDENNVSTAEEILTDHNERVQSENDNNNGNYVRCHCGNLCNGDIGLRANKCFCQVFHSQENLFSNDYNCIQNSSTANSLTSKQSTPQEHHQTKPGVKLSKTNEE